MKRSNPDSVHGIVIVDQSIPHDFPTAPRCYSGVLISENEFAALSLPPKFAVYSGIDEGDCEAQVEKGIPKLR